MTRRRAASFIEIACPDGRRFLLESPGQAMLDAVLAAIGVLPKLRRVGRDEPVTPGQARAFREASSRGEPVQ